MFTVASRNMAAWAVASMAVYVTVGQSTMTPSPAPTPGAEPCDLRYAVDDPSSVGIIGLSSLSLPSSIYPSPPSLSLPRVTRATWLLLLPLPIGLPFSPAQLPAQICPLFRLRRWANSSW